MQPVNVLGDQAEKLVAVIKLLEEDMGLAYCGIPDPLPQGFFALPVKKPLVIVGHELIKIDRLEFIPDAALAAVIRDAGLCAYTGAGEPDDPAAFCKRFFEFVI